ncbi:MAG: FAD:protein FMN transferase [Eubacteriaceae bacterium]|nr:FAD:protein FMN transferase [Eubacteriaceae bacterium]
MKKLFVYIILIAILLSFNSCGSEISKTPVSTKTTFAMDTVCTIKIYDKNADEKIIDDAFAYVSDLENLLSRYISTSDIAKINENAGKSYVKVDRHTLELLKECVYYSDQTDGAFDITLGSLIDLWDIESGRNYIPSKSEIENAMKYTGYKNILIDEKNCSVKLAKKGVIIDLGAVAKGYISQMTRQFLVGKGIKSAIIDFGGNIVLIGKNYKGDNFAVGIQKPFNDRGEYLAAVQSDNCAMVSSGNYERYFTGPDGVIYHHIIDPKTGYPAQNGLNQVTIIADDATVADILSTGVYVMGDNEGYDYIQKTENIGAVFVMNDGNVIVTENIKNYVNIIK